MFLQERHEKIIELLNENSRVNVKELSELFKVTEDCIRKDLKELESKSMLKRVYGGAILNRTESKYKELRERVGVNKEEKYNIAKKAITLINNKDRVFLDTSSINLEIAKLINESDLSIIIVTNMVAIAEVITNDNIQVILIGGRYRSNAGGTNGSEADNNIRKYSYTKAFIGVCGINVDEGYISSFSIVDGNTKLTIMNCSKNNYLVMETEKFNYDEFYKFADLNNITGIITNEKPHDDTERLLKDYNIEIF